METRLKKFMQREFRKANVKAFIFFLVFSSFIWLMVQLSKQYSKVISIPLIYENFPKDKVIEEETGNLDLVVTLTGFQLAWHKLSNPKIEVDLSKLPVEENYLNYRTPEYQLEIDKILPLDLNKAEFLEKEIHIPFEEKEVKTVPIIPRISVSYAPGYSSEDDLKLTPNSVTVSGPKPVLDTLTKIYTKVVKRKEVDSDLNAQVELENPEGSLTLFEAETNYNLEVQKFTERILEIPVTILNEPENAEVSLFPPVIEIKFQISLERYNRVQESDFEIVCDFDDLSEIDSFFIPKIKTKPDFLKNIQITPRKIEFIIKK